MGGDPYCGACGYSLRGLTDTTRCPECGKPIIEVLQRPGAVSYGRRYQSKLIFFGLPLVSIAVGPSGRERRGRARGIIAIGDIATGWLALGGFARGIIAFGGMSLGLISFGGASVGLLAFGGAAIGGVATGGAALGAVAQGGGAVGYIATGGGAIGVYARGGEAKGRYILVPNRRDPEAIEMFGRIDGLLGAPAGGPRTVGGQFRMVAFAAGWVIVILAVTCALMAAVILLAHARQRAIPPPR